MSNGNNNLTTFALGALAGGLTALLLAPMSGVELRERIGERGKEAKERATEAAQIAKEKAVRIAEDARASAGQEATALSAAVDGGKAAYEREKKAAKAS